MILARIRGGKSPGPLRETLQVDWERRLSDTTTASVNFAADCGIVSTRLDGGLLEVVRDGLVVWSGPISGIDYARVTGIIKAQDASSILTYRPAVGEFESTDLMLIAERLADAGFAIDNRHGYAVTRVGLAGVKGTRSYSTGEGKRVMDEIRELARTRIDWTCTPSGIVLFLVADAPVMRITDEDLISTPRVSENFDAVRNAWTIRGDNVTGTATNTESVTTHGYRWDAASEQSIKDQETADQAASTRARTLGAKSITIDSLEPRSVSLADRLAPGDAVRVTLSRTLFPVDEVVRISRIAYRVDDRSGLRAVVSVAPLGSVE